MKKIKLILIIMVMFLLSGCEANYSLYIDKDVFNETTTVLANSGELNTYDSQTYLTMKQKIDLYYKKYVDIVYQNPYYNPYLDDPQKGINYYNKELINNGKGYGFKYSYNFNKENYLNSNIINSEKNNDPINIGVILLSIIIPIIGIVYGIYNYHGNKKESGMAYIITGMIATIIAALLLGSI